MKVHIFGKQNFPDIAFKPSPKTGLSITARGGSYLLNYEGLNTITWRDLLERTAPSLKMRQKRNAKAFPEINRDFEFPKRDSIKVFDWIASKENLFQLAANAVEKKILKFLF